MAQTGFTPISLYYSSTATNVPTNTNLAAGELAINTADGKLFYKDSSGVVQVLATKATTAGTFTTVTTGTLTSPASTVLTVQSAGTTAITVDTSQNVGIGTTSPASYGKLTVSSTGTGLSVIGNSSNGGTVTIGDTPAYQGVLSYTGAGNTALSIDNTYNGSALGAVLVRVRTAGTPIIAGYFNSYGMGLNTAPSSGIGIAFPPTQVASSDANTLDDYEKGTWTPAQGSGLVVVGTFSSTGKYIKVGNLVFVVGTLSATTSLSSGSAVIINNLPFNSATSGTGNTVNGTITAVSTLLSSGANVFSNAISATTIVYFSLTYTV